MRTKEQRTKVLVGLSVAFVVAIGGGMASLSGKTAKAEISTLGGYVSYDPSKVALTEDYAPLVPYSTPMSCYYLEELGKQTYRNQFLTDMGRNTHLDGGRRGLLVKSKESGTAAEGSGVSFVNTLTGDFSMDFRVFSEMSYQGYAVGSAKNNDVTPDYYNTFLDAKEIGITISSTTTDDAFTVYVRGSSLYGHTVPNARVWVNGETYATGGDSNPLLGYGIDNATQGAVSWNYPRNTALDGTSFVNANQVGYSTYNTIEFDVETMKVYGVTHTYALEKLGQSNPMATSSTQKKVLIRDLSENPKIIADENNEYDYTTVKKLTNSKAFANGYTVSVSFTDVTANDTKLQKLANGTAGDTYHDYAVASNIQKDGADVVYDRYAKMVIYSLNGTDLVHNSGFTTSVIGVSVVGTNTWSDGTSIAGETEYTAAATGTSAEGATLSWNGVQTGEFAESFIVRSDDSTVTTEKTRNAQPQSKLFAGLGYNEDETLPYLDVKEVAFDFVSATDESKRFTLYVRATGVSSTMANRPSARVYIPGDKIMTTDFEYGYGLVSTAWGMWNQGGSFNAMYATKLDGFMGAYSANSSISVKFDVESMKVYGVYNGSYVLIRDLATNSGTNVPTSLCASLASSDFAGGYTVQFRFTDVCRDGEIASNGFNRVQDGSLVALGGANYSGSNSTSTAHVIFKTAMNLQYAAETKQNKVAPTAKIGDIELGSENELAPVFFGVFANEASVTGDISFVNGEQTGTIAANDEGKYVFTPTTEGEYTFTYSVAWNGETLSYETKATVVDEYSNLRFMKGETLLKEVSVKKGEETTLSAHAPEINEIGYTFVGWESENSVMQETFTPEGDMTIEAKLLYGYIEKASLSLDGTLGLNFYVRLPAAAKETDSVTFAVSGKDDVKVNFANAVASENNGYKFTYSVAAKDYKTDVVFTVDGGASKTYSVEDYCNAIASGDYDANEKAIVKATKDYCAAASNYFNDSTDHVADIPALTEDTLSGFAAKTEGTLSEDVHILGTTLLLRSGTALRVYFDSEVVCTVDNETATVQSKESNGKTVYYVEIDNISAQDLDKEFVIEIGEYALTCSAMSYVQAAYSEDMTDTAFSTVLRGLYAYNQAANTYFSK